MKQVVPWRLRNLDEVNTTSNKSIGVGVIGVGFVGGQAHAPAFRKIPNSRLVGLAASTERRVKPLAEKYGVKYFLNYEELVRDPEVQAIVVSSPTPFHFDAAMAAIQNGRHVLCEMPIATTIKETQALAEAADKAGVLLMPVLNLRFTPNYVKARELVDSGAIGKPVALSFREFIPAKDQATQWPAGSWAWDRSKSGGLPDYTLSVWSIDLVRWLLDSEYADVEWKSNYVRLEQHEGTLGYNTIGLAKMTNGVIVSLHYGSTVPPGAGTSRLEVFGEKTSYLQAESNNSLVLVGNEGAKQEWHFHETGTKVWGHYQMDEHFINCLLGKEKPKVTIDDAVKAQSVASKMVGR